MHILLTGGTGFIGRALAEALLARGDELVILTRQSLPAREGVRYICKLDEIHAQDNFSAVINLAGASLAARRWSAEYKREIVASRVQLTRGLLERLNQLCMKPATFVSASAIGYYGHHGDELLTEQGSVVPGFAQQLCHDWESAALAAQHTGSRVCLLRLGVVLDAGGGALDAMSRPFRFGMASWMGAGEQWLSWVHREDVIAAILFVLGREYLQGAFNLTAPGPVRSRDFALALSGHYRTVLRAGVPAPLLRLALGEMAQELLLNGQRVVPRRLLDAGFEFRHPDVQTALRAIYGQSA